MRQLMVSSFYGRERVARRRELVAPKVHAPLERAQAAGVLRPEIEHQDVPVLFGMVSSVADFAGDAAPKLWRRYRDLLLDGLRADGEDRSVLPEGWSDAALTAAMSTWRPTTSHPS